MADSSAPTAAAAPAKPIHSLVLDTGPLIKNDPPASVLIAKAEQLYTIPSVISEIRDAATRARVENTLLPFITVRSPNPESLRFVSNFAKKTGDYSVLSKPDLEVIALGYELELERNGGDWRLRNSPDQKQVNGRPPQASADTNENKNDSSKETQPVEASPTEVADEPPKEDAQTSADSTLQGKVEGLSLEETTEAGAHELDENKDTAQVAEESSPNAETATETQNSSSDAEEASPPENREVEEKVEEEPEEVAIEEVEEEDDDDDDDDEGWITPSNLKKHQNRDAGSSATNPNNTQKTLQAAILTSDYAMQNVALRINLNLVTPSLARITFLKNWVLRCHGCFAVCRDMEKQFCPRCGQQTLTRASCTTDQHGHFKLHLKRDFQWNNRGNVFSVPKPVHGTANGRLPKNAAGKNNWGKDLILTEDQKEHVRQQDEQRRQRKKDLMDDDFLPNLLSGHRPGAGGKIKVGAGRNVNSRRKR